jgi:hypothetical protein
MASARLLWRGSITVSAQDYCAGEPTTSFHNDPDPDGDDDVQLHGLAIVAPSFNVADLEQDDFFSSGSKATATTTNGNGASKAERINADLCLDLEMLRHRTLSVRSRRVKLAGPGNDGMIDNAAKEEGKVHGRRALKKSIEMLRKGKSRQIDSQEEGEIVHLDIPSASNQALKLYIDPRCQDTVEWFNEVFCSQLVDPVTLRTSTGIAISLGVENALLAPTNDARDTIVVYGQVDMRAANHSSAAPVLQLYVARQEDMTELGPRPDDPAPRGV